MSDVIDSKPGALFWSLAGFFLLFNLLGLLFYYMSVTATPEQIAASFSGEKLEFLNGTPTWATAAYAMAVNAGGMKLQMLMFL